MLLQGATHSAIRNHMLSNATIYSVSEISQNVKKTLETAFGYVHVRGELTEVKRAASGHIYATLKDKDAVLNAIVWKTSVPRLQAKPEDGLEVIATGRMTTYPGRSNYQLIVEQLEVAGEGALLKLIEERRKKLAAEGLFDASRKRDLPQFPSRIAVITSPTGAVIRDIMHRLEDRWPVEVLLFPVLVQGEGAAQQTTKAIHAVSLLPEHIRPDVVIVARGGGSLEDLMAFNDEALVRAAANCPVPLISAVGHETDTTLIDWASDRRAPTPTAAAEIVTPHQGALMEHLRQQSAVMTRAVRRKEDDLVQKLDHNGFQITRTLNAIMDRYLSRLTGLRLRSPLQILDHQDRHLHQQLLRLSQSFFTFLDRKEHQVNTLVPASPAALLEKNVQRLDGLTTRIHQAQNVHVERKEKLLPENRRLTNALTRLLDMKEQKLSGAARLIETVSHKSVLKRGFVLVQDGGKTVTSAALLIKGQSVTLHFHDGEKDAEIR